MKTINRLFSLLLCLLLTAGLCAPSLAAAAEETTVIRIYTVRDFIDFAEQCTLDSWSRDKKVLLQADLDLSLTAFRPIATFGGTFDGQGHTISGLNLRPNGEVQGLFRYIQPTGVVKNLTVCGIIMPSDHKAVIGGIAGMNRGTITKCTFDGTLRGETSIGGIVGINQTSGQIINCSFRGELIGQHYVGGIAGQNLGSVVRGRNDGQINTVEVKATIDPEGLDLEQLNSAANMPACTDVGGIAGFSSGTLQSCTNNGSVGYPHVGYNIGGIVGRQSGYVDNCVNNGFVQGRKDVGGIAGQMEPQLMLKYDQTALDQIWGELDTLEGMIDGFLENTDGSANRLTDDIKGLSDSASTVKDAVADLSDAAVQWADSGIGQINDASARVSWVMERITPVTDTLVSAMDQIESAVDSVSVGLDNMSLAAQYGADAAEAMKLAMEDLQSALDEAQTSLSLMETAMEQISLGLGDREVYETALDNTVLAVRTFTNAFYGISSALNSLYQAMEQVTDWVLNDPAWISLRTEIGNLRDAFSQVAGAVSGISDALNAIVNDTDLQHGTALLAQAVSELMEGVQTLSAAMEGVITAYEEFRAGNTDRALEALDTAFALLDPALGKLSQGADSLTQGIELITNSQALQTQLPLLKAELGVLAEGLSETNNATNGIHAALDQLELSDVPETALTKVRNALGLLLIHINSISDAMWLFSHTIDDLEQNLDLEQLETAWETLQSSVSSLESAADALGGTSEDMADAMDLLSQAADSLSAGLDQFSNAGTTLSDAFGTLEQAVTDVNTILEELNDMPTIAFDDLETAVSDEGEALNTAADGLIDSFNKLNSTLRGEADLLTGDLQKINGQLGVITDLLQRFQQEQTAKESGDLLEDVSGDAADDTMTSGKISDCENVGSVAGDLNVAGIAGSIAIEYDFDPEDDLIVSGGRSIDFSYLSRAVIYGCINRGEITAKKNDAGGIVGLMDLGYAGFCQSYGPITSTAGSYVGGIAGESYGAIDHCWAKCTLSAGNYVGGIAGFGSVIEHCRTLIDANFSTPFTGAVAGQMADDSILSGNLFVHHKLAGVDGVSYDGGAQPISYEMLIELEDLPTGFTEFALTFTADGKTVAVIPFRYGVGIDHLPEIPQKAVHSSRWPELDYSALYFSRTVEALYTPYDTSLSDGQSLPHYLVDGSFGPDAQVSVVSTQVDWLSRSNDICQIPAYTVTVTDPAAEQVSFTLHWRLPEEGSCDLWILENGAWIQHEYTPDGSYLLLTSSGGSLTFCLTPREHLPLWAWAAMGCGAIALIIIASAIAKKSKRKAKTAV